MTSNSQTEESCRDVFERLASTTYDLKRRADGCYENRDTEACYKGWSGAWVYRAPSAPVEKPVSPAVDETPLREALLLCKVSAENWHQQSPHTQLVVDTVNKALSQPPKPAMSREELVDMCAKAIWESNGGLLEVFNAIKSCADGRTGEMAKSTTITNAEAAITALEQAGVLMVRG